MSGPRIGYMGIPFSNSDAMARIFSERAGLKGPEFVPLMSARDTMDAMVEGSIDYGVFAMENRIAGKVIETDNALKWMDYEILDEGWLPIHHCVFLREEGDEVKRIVSHIQALLQSSRNLRRLYPDAVLAECEDTAYAAEMLAKGELPEGSAALCRRDAGEHYGLYLANENVEDNSENMTRFALIRMRRS
jgi:prephenate dehydratase